MKKILLLIVLCSAILWANGPTTVRFCALNVGENDSHISFYLHMLGDVLPDKKWNLPDSLPCGSVRWKNWLSFKHRGVEFELDESVLNPSERFSCKLCDGGNRLLRKPTFKSRIEDLRYSYYRSSYSQEKISIDKDFLKSLYGKTIKAVWEGAYSCFCPEYETPKWTTTLNMVVEGECPSSVVTNSVGTCSDDNVADDEVAEEYVSNEGFGDSVKSFVEGVLTRENSPKDPTPAEGLFACYYGNATKNYHPVNAYASFKPMIMADKAQGLEESLECFEDNGERFLVFGTNIPRMFYSTAELHKRGYKDECFVNKGNFDKMEEIEKPFYTCGYTKTDYRGCKAVSHGVDIVVNMDLKCEVWGQKALLPQNVTEQVLLNVGDDAAQKTAGMQFYKGRKKVKYEKYDRNHFKSLKEAVNACKVFDF